MKPRRPSRDSIGPDEEVIRSDELAELRAIRRAHDDYLAGQAEMYRRRVRVEQSAELSQQYRAGWLDCLREYSAAVLAAMRGRR